MVAVTLGGAPVTPSWPTTPGSAGGFIHPGWTRAFVMFGGAPVTPSWPTTPGSAGGFIHPGWTRATVAFGIAVGLAVARLDYPILSASKTINGVTRNAVGDMLGGCVVKLFRQSDDALCRITTSDVSGVYSFPRDSADVTAYYVLSYHLAPEVHGTSDRSLIPS